MDYNEMIEEALNNHEYMREAGDIRNVDRSLLGGDNEDNNTGVNRRRKGGSGTFGDDDDEDDESSSDSRPNRPNKRKRGRDDDDDDDDGDDDDSEDGKREEKKRTVALQKRPVRRLEDRLEAKEQRDREEKEEKKGDEYEEADGAHPNDDRTLMIRNREEIEMREPAERKATSVSEYLDREREWCFFCSIDWSKNGSLVYQFKVDSMESYGANEHDWAIRVQREYNKNFRRGMGNREWTVTSIKHHACGHKPDIMIVDAFIKKHSFLAHIQLTNELIQFDQNTGEGELNTKKYKLWMQSAKFIKSLHNS